MIGFAIFAIVLATIYLDSRALERTDSLIYRETMRVSPLTWTLLLGLLFPVGAVYLWQRRMFLSRLAASEDAIRPPQPQFSVAREASGAIILWSVCMVSLAFVVEFLLDSQGLMARFVVTDLLAIVLLVFVIARAILRTAGGDFWAATGWRGGKFSLSRWVLLPLAIGGGLAWLVDSLAASIPEAVTPLDNLVDGASDGAIMVFVGMGLLIAPFVEELVFRGYLYRVVEILRGRWTALVLVSFLFALLHVEQYWSDWLAIAAILLISFLLTGMRMRSGSSVPSTVVHYAYNIGLLMIPLAMLQIQNPSYVEYMRLGPESTPSERVELLERSLEEDPENVSAMNDLAWLFAEQDLELERALELIETALDREPDAPAYVDTRAEVLFRSGRIEEAIATEEYLLRADLENPHYRDQLERFRRGTVGAGGGARGAERAATPSDPSFDRLFPVRRNQLVGLIDGQGDLVVEPRFDLAGEMAEGLLAVNDDGLWGYVNASGRFFVYPRFGSADRFSEGLAAVVPYEGPRVPGGEDEPIHIGGSQMRRKGGYVNRLGILVIPAQFSGVTAFSEGLAAVRKGDRWGYIDTSGEWAVTPHFLSASSFRDGLAAVLLQDGYSFIDTTGKITIAGGYFDAYAFSEGLAAVREEEDGPWGFIDRTGGWAIEPTLYGAASFSEGLAAVRIGAHWGFVDRDGKVVIEPTFSEAREFSEGLAAVQVIGGSWGFVDRSGALKVEPIHETAESFRGGLARVGTADFRWGYIDTTGRSVWDPTQ